MHDVGEISKNIRIIVGLGNPGPRYENTYHNVGRLALRALTETIDTGEKPPTRRKTASYSWWRAGNFTFVEPSVYMNDAGSSVRAALKALRAKPHHTLLIHDDSDITLGAYKFSFGRGAAGHRGVLSVFNALKTTDIWRLRIGIRTRKGKADEFVLRKISVADRRALQSVFEKSTEKVIEKETPPGTLRTSVSGKSTERK